MKTLNEKIAEYLRGHLKPERFRHTVGTAKVAAILAERHGADIKDAVQAALLHDAGKSYSPRQMVAYAKKHNIKAPCRNGIFKHNPSLLHSYLSAHLARKNFNVKKRSVLDAIAQHTLGAKNMTKLAKIIYVSDIIAPERRYKGVRQLRRLAMRDLYLAMRAAQKIKLNFVIDKNAWLHPMAICTWNNSLK
jgi:nicotinate-nucleotide adenylyltransferase